MLALWWTSRALDENALEDGNQRFSGVALSMDLEPRGDDGEMDLLVRVDVDDGGTVHSFPPPAQWESKGGAVLARCALPKKAHAHSTGEASEGSLRLATTVRASLIGGQLSLAVLHDVDECDAPTGRVASRRQHPRAGKVFHRNSARRYSRIMAEAGTAFRGDKFEPCLSLRLESESMGDLGASTGMRILPVPCVLATS